MAKTPAAKTKKAETKKAPPPPEVESIYTEDIAREEIPNVLRLSLQSLQIAKKGWRVLLALAGIYIVMNLILVQGLNAASNLDVAKKSLDLYGTSATDKITNGFSLYTYLIGATGNNIAPTAGAFQFMAAVVITLATIWALRQLYAGRSFRLRDTFYYGMYPLITFLLVLLMVLLHLLPFALGSVLYGIITANGIASTVLETVSFLFVFLALSFMSIYLVCSSLFALYIVTLPEMTPMGALRSARELVAFRRWTVMRKVLFLPVALLALGAIVLIPIILFATPLAPWVFTAVAAFALLLVHIYMYTLYRALL